MRSAEIRPINPTEGESYTDERQKKTSYTLGRLALLARQSVDQDFSEYGDAAEAAEFTYADLQLFLQSQEVHDTRMAHYAMQQLQRGLIDQYDLADIDLAKAKQDVLFPLSLVAAALCTDNINGEKSRRVWQDFFDNQISRLRSQA